ncbi:MAG: DUF58 domain-containing protein [Spirochaetota bacterium]|nr:DUF58 domain-containing protein [Spirochaetota bacterium]
MDNKEILKKVKLFEIKSKKHVQKHLAGAYHSVFKGKGIEFFDVKEYNIGDDIKNIDWNVTARSETCYIKNYIEERELDIIIAVDISGSQQFGSQIQFKQDLSVEIAALLAFSALKNQDKVGLFLFSDIIEKIIPPKKGRNHIMRLVRDLIYHQATNLKTDLNLALSTLQKTLKKRTIIFFISDFIDDKDFTKSLKILANKHDLVTIKISDPLEELALNVGYIRFGDNESDEEYIINLNNKNFKAKYNKLLQTKEKELKTLFRKADVDFLHFKTHIPYITQLTKFFIRRAKRY